MKYLVMECHIGYAVVLDEDGRFVKVANLNYEVGQTVTDVIIENLPIEYGQSLENDHLTEIEEPISIKTPKVRRMNRWMKPFVAVAACLCFLIIVGWQMLFTPYGSVEMVINPDVLIEVNRLDYVIDVEGLNEDGVDLITDYSYRFKKIDQVSDELADRAAQMGYLKDGGTIHLIVSGGKEEWKVITEERLLLELEVHMGETYIIELEEFREDIIDLESGELMEWLDDADDQDDGDWDDVDDQDEDNDDADDQDEDSDDADDADDDWDADDNDDGQDNKR